MESIYEVKPQLDEQGRFWKELQYTCLQAFTSVCWSKSNSLWYPKSCKFHVYQGILCKAVRTIEESSFVNEMKRKHADAQPARYIFVVDAVLRHHEFTLEEAKFLKQVNFDGFVNKVTWKVLHEALVREAIANLNTTDMTTTVQGKTFPLLAAQWKDQLRDIFEFTTRKATSTKKWELTELFPSLKEAAPGRETVKVSDCTYPGAEKPLRILSSLFCLNTTGQDHISISFAELIMAALNGNTIDWVEEFHQELQDEIVKLHQKHTQNPVKVERTAIGPHLTLILKAAGVMNLRHAAEAGFHTPSPSSASKPHKKRCKDAPKPPSNSKSTVRVVPAKVIDLEQESSEPAPPPQSSEVPQSTVYETEEPWQVPKEVPNLVQQISQTHRRLENLLTKLSSKAPPRLMRNVDHQFYKLQRETVLKEGSEPEKGQAESSPTNMISSLTTQIGRLEEKLANKEELIDLYIENSFEAQNKLAEQEEETSRLKSELNTVNQRDQVELLKIQNLEETHTQQLQAKEKEAVDLQQQVQKLTAEAEIQKQKIKDLHKTQRQEREELTKLRAEVQNYRAARARTEHGSNPRSDLGFDQTSHRPIDRTERQALATGAAEQMLSDLQQALEVSKREKEELQHQLQEGVAPQGHMGLPPSYIHPRAEIYNKMLEHTAPLKSVMQYYQIYRVLDLLTNNLPMLKRGITLNQVQFKELWDQANPRTKDMLAFTWAVGDLKLPLGVIEMVTGSPPFYLKRYMLRSIASLSQHKTIQIKRPSISQPLPNLRPYTHGQKLEITKLQHKNKVLFQQALESLKREDTGICFEAVRRHQWLMEHHPDQAIEVTLPQIKAFVTQTLEEQQISITRGQFGTINNGTLLHLPVPDQPDTLQGDNYEA